MTDADDVVDDWVGWGQNGRCSIFSFFIRPEIIFAFIVLTNLVEF